jgi:uncharacterized protein (DUF3084 family)
MSDDRTTAPAPEVAPPTQPVPETETEETELDPADLEELSEEESLEEDVEIDVDGVKHRIPAALKDKFLMQADYTKKTQTLAEERRQLEQAGKDFQAQQKALQSHVGEVSKLVAFDEQLALYDQVDWIALNRQDPVKAQELQFQRQALERQRNGLGEKLASEWNARVTHEQQEIAKRYEQGLAVIAKSIPDWSQAYADKLTDYATRTYGASKEQLREVQLMNPGFVAVLDKAFKLDQILAKQRARAREPEAPPPTPVTTVGARRSPASSEPRDSDDMDTWLRKRNAQVARRQKAGLR